MEELSDTITFLGTAGARFVVTKQFLASGGAWLNLGGTQILLDPGPGCLPDTVPEGLLAKLQNLDDGRLATRLSRYLDKKEIQALVRRKAAIIRLLEGLGH